MASGKARGGLPFGLQVIIGTVASVLVGVAGGYTAEYLEAPFFFGFLFAGVLAGMVVLFILAARLGAAQGRRDP
jgi:uncharacterized membrane protein YedE/YeeE